MRTKYTIVINTNHSAVIEEQWVTHIMTEFFNMVHEKPLSENVFRVTREDLPEETLEEAIKRVSKGG